MKKISILLAALVALTLTLTLTATAQSLLVTDPETPAQRTARELEAGPKQVRDGILNSLDDLSQRLWLSQDPAPVLAALGTNAAKVFALNTKFGILVATLLTEEGDSAGLARLMAIQARTPAITIHEDGTVTIDPVPVPEEE